MVGPASDSTVPPEVINALSKGTCQRSLQGLDENQLDAEILKTLERAQQETLVRKHSQLNLVHWSSSVS